MTKRTLYPWTCVRSACKLKGLVVLTANPVPRCLDCQHGLMPFVAADQRGLLSSGPVVADRPPEAYPSPMGSDWWSMDDDRRPSTSRRTARWGDHGANIYWVYEVRVGHQAGSMRLGEFVVHGTKEGELLCSINQEAETV